ncbi:MAG: MBL fold metallo-hydrolase [Planctomycetes bacterium]|nr:MBL fold metallo-hydrolase [Planctomycetota bacterium]
MLVPSSKPASLVCVLLVLPLTLAALDEPRPMPVEALAPDLHVLRGGRDGNVLVLGDADGALLVDSLTPGREPELLATLGSLGIEPGDVRFVVDTHYHEDHVGANDELAAAGALLVAHDETRRLMTLADELPEMGWTITPAPEAALPTLTFADGLTLHVGEHVVRLVHLPAAHTGGDVLVQLADANVLHVGDVFELGAFPFVDLWHGGSFDGLLAALDTIAEMSDDATRIVPGHGPVSDRKTVRAEREVVARVLERAALAVADDLDFDTWLGSGPLDDVDPKWGTGRDAVRFAWLAYNDRVMARDAKASADDEGTGAGEDGARR